MVVLPCPTGFVLRDATLAALLGDPDVLLPLPFTREADPADVVAHLRRLNPHRTVRFEALPTGHWPPLSGGELAAADRRQTGP